MRLNISSKLFFGVLATNLLIALVMAVVDQWGFQRDFRDYIDQVEIRRTEAARQSLAELYARTGDWSALADQPGNWRALLRGTYLPSRDGIRNGGNRSRRSMQDIALYDSRGNRVVGKAFEESSEPIRQPVLIDDVPVGWLVRARSPALMAATEVQFQRAQLRNIGVAMLAAVLLAALAAALLSRTFLAPVRSIGEASHRLAAGNFDTCVSVDSRDEFGRLADDFNVLARTLQRNQQMRRYMMADVTHELRTPLAVIRAELDALQDGIRPSGPIVLESMQSEVQKLSLLVDDVYQLALSDAGALDYRRSDLELRSELLSALRPLQDRCAEAGLELAVNVQGPPLMVHADPDRISQLVGNLVENALRYTDAPGRIEIDCRHVRGHAVLEIRDSVPGVPPEALPHLFDRFFRVEGLRYRASGGAGLGLAICQNIMAAHGGKIEARPSRLGGLCIIARFPCLRAS